ncbi:hypothetical protein NDK25_23830 [Niallia taxi]|nr:hypothetical protein [Niallia taxi]MDE5055249.1 hypothetical protein [Niallia taxi]
MGHILNILSVKPKKLNTDNLVNDIYNDFKKKHGIIETHSEIEYYGFNILNEAIELKASFNFNEKKYDVKFLKRTFNTDNIILETSLKTDDDSVDLTGDYYSIKNHLKTVLVSHMKGVYWQKDSQNEEVCAALYRDIHILENRFRELIVQFMVNKFGISWTKNQITEELNKKINEFSKWYKTKYTDFKNVKTELFNLQVNDLIKLLQKAYDNKKISDNELITLIKQEGTDITQVISDYKEGLTQLSIWEKYFKEILGNSFDALWNEFNSMRNMVAHNKPICFDLYNDTVNNITSIKTIFEAVARDFKNRFKSTEEIEIEDFFYELNGDLYDERDEMDHLHFEEAGLEITPDEDDVIEQISDSEEIQTIIEDSQEHISSLASLWEEIHDIVDSDFDDQLDFSDVNKVDSKLKDISNVFKANIKIEENTYLLALEGAKDHEDYQNIWSDIKGEIIDYCQNKIDQINNSTVEETFILESSIIDIDTGFTKIKIYSDGYITPERASSDKLNINLVINGTESETGIIEKYYGEYLIDDSGAAMATHGDELVINLDNIIKLLLTTIQNDFNKLVKYRDSIFNLL